MADFEHEIEKETEEAMSNDIAENNESNENNESDVSSSTDADIIPTPKKISNLFKDLVDYFEVLVLALGAVVLLFSFCFRLCTVSGDSMKNTLYDGESVIVTDLFYKPSRGDIIVFHDTNDLKKPLVKRVIATEGETVSITYLVDGMDVSITDTSGNTVKYREDYVNYSGNGGVPPYWYGTVGQTVVYNVPENKIFVMGDNRNESKDSRDSSVGFIDERTVLGKVILQVTPFDKLGFIGKEDY